MYLGNDGVKEKRVEDDVGRRPVLFLEYYKLRRRLKALYRKKAAYIRCLHNNLANRIIRHGIDILAEKMNYKALQKRSKKTERQEKTSTVKKKDGTTLEIKKYKKKKRYGSSLNNRAPSSFLSILERKCNQYGGHLQYVNTQKMRASQYNHDTDTCKKIPLSQRRKLVCGQIVLRDAYSAFLIQHANARRTKADRGACTRDFHQFLSNQGRFILTTKQNNPKHSACFGF